MSGWILEHEQRMEIKIMKEERPDFDKIHDLTEAALAEQHKYGVITGFVLGATVVLAIAIVFWFYASL